MKNILSPILKATGLLVLFAFVFAGKSAAQPFSNSWIKFSNTYYKFRIAQEGAYRISKAQLDAIGMGNVPGNQFAVFREGQEVPVYTSTSGAFGSNDFIELYATKANGKMDTDLYPDPSFQPNTDVNIISDTAYYFLTFDNTVHQRLQLVSNTIPAPAPAVAPYCWTTAYPVEEIRSFLDPGQSHTNQEYFYSSDFDLAEGYSYTGPVSGASLNVPTPHVYASGPAASVSFVIGCHSKVATQHHPYVSLNGGPLFDTLLPPNVTFRMIKRTVNAGAGTLAAGNTPVGFSDDFNFYLLGTSIRYPSTYDFSGNFSAKASFEIPAADRYLEISGFTTGGQTPKLYDRTNNKIYTGTESGGVVKFYLDISPASRQVFLTNAASVTDVTAFNPV